MCFSTDEASMSSREVILGLAIQREKQSRSLLPSYSSSRVVLNAIKSVRTYLVTLACNFTETCLHLKCIFI